MQTIPKDGSRRAALVVILTISTLGYSTTPAVASIVFSFEARVSINANPLTISDFTSGPTPGSTQHLVHGNARSVAEAVAAAVPGAVSAFAQGAALVVPFVSSTEHGFGYASANFGLDDLVFTYTGPPDSATSTTQVSGWNLVIESGGTSQASTSTTTQSDVLDLLSGSGSFGVAGTTLPLGNSSLGTAYVGVDAFVGNSTFSGFRFIELSQPPGKLAQSQGGLLDISSSLEYAPFTTDSFVVPVGQPLGFGMSVRTEGRASANGSAATAAGFSRFGSTFTLPTNGPVFNLPAGYTANSVQANIVDNHWLGGSQPSVIPEPASLVVWSLLGLGMIGMVRLRRRH